MSISTLEAKVLLGEVTENAWINITVNYKKVAAFPSPPKHTHAHTLLALSHLGLIQRNSDLRIKTYEIPATGKERVPHPVQYYWQLLVTFPLLARKTNRIYACVNEELISVCKCGTFFFNVGLLEQ